MEATVQRRDTFHATTAASIVAVAILVASALLAARRLVGAFRLPLPTPLLLAAVAVLAFLIWGLRITWPRHRRSSRLATWAPAASILLAMFAFSWPLSLIAHWCVWLPLVAAEVVFHTRPHAGRSEAAGGRDAADVLPQTPHDDQLLQDITRLRNPATGAESLFGTLRAEFTPGERTDILHVAFCPPFAGTPNVEAEQAEGPDAVVRVTQALAHGARLEVRLASTATEVTSVLIDFAASEAVR